MRNDRPLRTGGGITAPGLNDDRAHNLASMEKLAAVMARTGDELWIHHDKSESAALPRAPRYVEWRAAGAAFSMASFSRPRSWSSSLPASAPKSRAIAWPSAPAGGV